MDESDVGVNEAVAERPKAGLRWYVVAGGVVFGALMLGGGLWLGKMMYASPVSEVKPIAVVSPIPTLVPTDLTANWKTYTNNQYGFSFRYPVSATLTNTNCTGSLASVTINNNDPIIRQLTFYVDSGWNGKGDAQNAPRNTQVGGVMAYKKILPGVQNLPKDNYFFEKDGKVYVIQLVLSANVDEDQKARTLTDQILSTFKFTDTATSWTSYQDKERGFSFKYPADWYLDPVGPGTLYGVTTITSYDPSPLSRDWKKFKLTNNDFKIQLSWSAIDYKIGDNLESWVKNNSEITQGGEPIKFPFGSFSAYYVTGPATGPMETGELIRIYYILVKNKIFTVGIRPADTIHLSEVEQVVSTLKF